jgi:hypothetical protein
LYCWGFTWCFSWGGGGGGGGGVQPADSARGRAAWHSSHSRQQQEAPGDKVTQTWL